MDISLAKLSSCFVRLCEASRQALLSYHPSEDPLLCEMIWRAESPSEILVSSRAIARMERVSRHKQIEATAIELDYKTNMRALSDLVSRLPGGDRVKKMRIEIFAPHPDTSTSMNVELNDFSVCDATPDPYKISQAILTDTETMSNLSGHRV